MVKKEKKFRPLKIPRYLIGPFSKEFCRKDLEAFNEFRYRLFTAQPKVDDRPLKFNPHNYINKKKLADDAERLRQIDKENKELLKAINIINHTKGRVDTYNPVAYDNASKWRRHESNMKRIQRQNKVIYNMIIDAKSHYSRRMMNEFWANIVDRLKSTCKFPFTIMQKGLADSVLARLPSISANLDKILERPRCFLEFKVKGGPYLGRVLVELYYDYVPVTVQNFLGICSEQGNLSYKNCVIHRIVPGKYCETGDITLGTGRGGASIYGDYFAEEKHILKHSKAGVLSMVRLRRHENNSQFCITFNKVEMLDRRNVVFGKIIKGADNLFKIEGYGRRIGKPLADVIISNCGLVP